ncbi:MAG: hypothetical protein Q4A65_05135 [Bacillota bacterium]|nr:hypothetical protein [Bacillota bacterium]
MTSMGIVLAVVIIAIIIGAVLKKKDHDKGSDEIITSQSLHEQVNQERMRDGKESIPAINNIGGTSTNNLARRDKSWNSVPDFFIKMAKNNSKEGAPHDE